MLTGMQKPKRPRDTNQMAKFLVDMATGEQPKPAPVDDGKDPAAVALGRKGGKARAAVLSANERSKIARKAAKKRWKNN